MQSEYGLKIRNIKAGSLYGYNLKVRDKYDYKKAMFTNNLLLNFLKENGLKIDKGWTKDIIGINFDYGSRSYEEEKSHVEKLIENKDEKYTEKNIEYFNQLLVDIELNKENFDKKSEDEIRELFYPNGVEVEYLSYKKDKSVKKSKKIHYQFLYRSTGKAKNGSCIFICDRLYKKANKFIQMGIKLPNNDAPLVEMLAYSSLISSTIVDTIKINPRNILVMNDVDSFFETNIISVETDEQKHFRAVYKENYKLKNTLFDGQAIVDESIFPKWGNGYILLRHHMCKMAGFKGKLQKFLKDYYGDNYLTEIVYDMWGNPHYAKDIEVITTDNAMKWLKFGVSYEYWCDRVHENGCLFGIVKTAHESKLGSVQRMSYQMINSLDIDIMPNVVAKSKEYIELMKRDNLVFLDYLRMNKNFSNDYEVLIALCEQNWDFTRSEYFRRRKEFIVRIYVNDFKFGKVIQDADNLVIIGSPYAMLLHMVGEDVDNDITFSQEENCIQCYTSRFADGEYLAEFRSPFNSKNNMGYLHNVYPEILLRYFDFGKQIIAINMIHTDFQDRNNGSDMDSDNIYTTNQEDIVNYAKYCYITYPTIVNNIPKSTKKYDNTMLNCAKIDNNLASAQKAIGRSSNLAQLAQTYMYNFEDQKYVDYVCILSVLAQVAIDNAKRQFDIDLNKEIDLIENDMNIKKHKYPKFWKHIKDKKCKVGQTKFNKNRINNKLKCPMNEIVNLKFVDSRSNEETLPMSYFFQKFELNDNDKRRKSRKIEELIQNYSLDIYNSNNEDDDEYILMRSDFDELLENIRLVSISSNYIGLYSWLIDRAFNITDDKKRTKQYTKSKTEKNKSMLINVLFNINKKNLLKIFSKNA
jgi:hypothetical protein